MGTVGVKVEIVEAGRRCKGLDRRRGGDMEAEIVKIKEADDVKLRSPKGVRRREG
jgi:hypothetical protein